MRYAPDSFNFLVLFSESLFHFGTERLESSIGVGEFVLGILECIFSITESRGEIVTFSGKSDVDGGQVVDSSVSILQGIVSVTKLVCILKTLSFV